MSDDSQRGAAGWRLNLWREGPAWVASGLLALAAAAAWLIAGPLRTEAMSLALVWAGAVLAFQAGERRGRALAAEEGGAEQDRSRVGRAARVSAPWLFALAVGSMLALQPLESLAFLMTGQASLAITAAPQPDPLRRFGPAMLAFVSLALIGSRLMFAV